MANSGDEYQSSHGGAELPESDATYVLTGWAVPSREGSAAPSPYQELLAQMRVTPASHLIRTRAFQQWWADNQPERDPVATEQIADAVRLADGFPMPGEVPAGMGRWEWLEEADSWRARATGYVTHEAVEQARAAGRFTDGYDLKAGPIAVWYPDSRYFNPRNKSINITPGRFQFHTTADHALARINLGGQEGFGFENNPDPSAEEVWRLQREYDQRFDPEEGDLSPVGNINIVFAPYIVDVDHFLGVIEEFLSGEESDDSDDEVDGIRTGTAAGQRDAVSGLLHDPLKRGENDQTGVFGRAQYQTRLLPDKTPNAKSYTVDRSGAHHGEREDWKTWACDKRGKWVQYKSKELLDWNDKASVNKLNKWREQIYSRHGWSNKRDIHRVVYTRSEKEWLFDFVKRAEGKEIRQNITKLTKMFNEKFAASQQKRDPSGIATCLHRLRQQYAQYSGEMRPERETGNGKATRQRSAKTASAKTSQKRKAGRKARRGKAKKPRVDQESGEEIVSEVEEGDAEE
ncbi:hypothetical protein BAUCODRAFT_274598 [Baudoinia panamericana UAMH 10762]|uniref:Uncharacterized protein n=1 Tax=Baudoinia panamericana (strain UAMH 10762) TaxID=717646 RepID=M2N0D9_BAUPA|nr:uncharacterized protein BAUCODRAFT_274598 [Baudoinia panamericana UAMH 10762]EMC92045.1 hypothetical protein BAUCODRAFT_274598 [Baudoinia panamericana UAMH 10762]